MAPTRCGPVPVVEVLNQIQAGATVADIRKMCMKSGGYVGLLGTSDSREVEKRILAADAGALRARNALVYHLTPHVGRLQGRVEVDAKSRDIKALVETLSLSGLFKGCAPTFPHEG